MSQGCGRAEAGGAREKGPGRTDNLPWPVRFSAPQKRELCAQGQGGPSSFRENKPMRSYVDQARTRWPEAERIEGDGPYACLSSCGDALTVTLWQTDSEAQEEKDRIDEMGCRGNCHRLHQIVRL